MWADSLGRIWVSEWNAGQVSAYDPSTGDWNEWKLPGDSPRAYAVYVDENDAVWLSDFGANTVVQIRPGDRGVRGLRSAQHSKQRATDSGPARRGVAAGVRGRPACCDSILSRRQCPKGPHFQFGPRLEPT